MKKFVQVAAVAAVFALTTASASFADDKKKSDDPITGVAKFVESVVMLPIKVVEELTK